MPKRQVVILSNRGPVSFVREGDELVGRRGAGGLVSGIGPLVADTQATWVAAAISAGDRQAAASGLVEAEGFRALLLDIDPALYRMAYDVVCNATLWFVHHGLYDLARRPRLDRRWREAWAAYRTVNETFAKAAAELAPPDAAVLVQDYHLALVGEMLRDARPDVRTVHFSHTPFCGPDLLRVLPRPAAEELLTGMAGHHACGFHTDRWAASFRECCDAFGVAAPPTFVAPLAADIDDVRSVAGGERCESALADFAALVGDRSVIARVDRMELSKNLLRGFLAFDDLLEYAPEWRERVTVVACVYPSREGLPEYLAYRQEVEGLVRRLNERWATPGWTPILLEVSDNFPRSIAALRRADVVLVNPIRDGLNLVAKEAMVVNERDAALVLSTEAGVWDEIGERGAIAVNPFDVSSTADALDAALRMAPDERARRAAGLREAVLARTPGDWLADQLRAAG